MFVRRNPQLNRNDELIHLLSIEGLPASILTQILDTAELGAGRANLYARVKGNGTKKAIALVHHIDVVPVSPEHWTVPPFAGEVGEVLGLQRGLEDERGAERDGPAQGDVCCVAVDVGDERQVVLAAQQDECARATQRVGVGVKHARAGYRQQVVSRGVPGVGCVDHGLGHEIASCVSSGTIWIHT